MKKDKKKSKIGTLEAVEELEKSRAWVLSCNRWEARLTADDVELIGGPPHPRVSGNASVSRSWVDHVMRDGRVVQGFSPEYARAVIGKAVREAVLELLEAEIVRAAAAAEDKARTVLRNLKKKGE